MEIKSFQYAVPQITYLIKSKLWAQVLFALFMGFVFGIFLGPEIGVVEKGSSELITDWLSIPANLFLKIIQMMIVPLIFASIIRGLTSAGTIEQLQKLGLGVALYFVATTAIALAIGILVVTTIMPGNFIDSSLIKESFGIEETANAIDGADLTFQDIPQSIISLIPSNPLGALVSGEMLSIIIFAIIVGVSMISLPKATSKPILDLLESVQKITMKVVSWAMRLAPFAAFGLMADITSKLGLSALAGLGAYMITVVIGLFAMLMIYIIIIKIAKRPIFSTFKMMKNPQLLAFSTSSSAAVMPLSIKTAEEEMKVKSQVSQFIIPLGATINMDGTALYQVIAVFFLAQLFGIDLGFTTILLITLTALAASIGAPSAPGTGIVILSTILIAAGIPVVGIVLLLGVDRILDMTRTMVNVTGDLTACLFFDKRMKKQNTEIIKNNQENLG